MSGLAVRPFHGFYGDLPPRVGVGSRGSSRGESPMAIVAGAREFVGGFDSGLRGDRRPSLQSVMGGMCQTPSNGNGGGRVGSRGGGGDSQGGSISPADRSGHRLPSLTNEARCRLDSSLMSFAEGRLDSRGSDPGPSRSGSRSNKHRPSKRLHLGGSTSAPSSRGDQVSEPMTPLDSHLDYSPANIARNSETPSSNLACRRPLLSEWFLQDRNRDSPSSGPGANQNTPPGEGLRRLSSSSSAPQLSYETPLASGPTRKKPPLEPRDKVRSRKDGKRDSHTPSGDIGKQCYSWMKDPRNSDGTSPVSPNLPGSANAGYPAMPPQGTSRLSVRQAFGTMGPEGSPTTTPSTPAASDGLQGSSSSPSKSGRRSRRSSNTSAALLDDNDDDHDDDDDDDDDHDHDHHPPAGDGEAHCGGRHSRPTTKDRGADSTGRASSNGQGSHLRLPVGRENRKSRSKQSPQEPLTPTEVHRSSKQSAEEDDPSPARSSKESNSSRKERRKSRTEESDHHGGKKTRSHAEGHEQGVSGEATDRIVSPPRPPYPPEAEKSPVRNPRRTSRAEVVSADLAAKAVADVAGMRQHRPRPPDGAPPPVREDREQKHHRLDDSPESQPSKAKPRPLDDDDKVHQHHNHHHHRHSSNSSSNNNNNDHNSSKQNGNSSCQHEQLNDNDHLALVGVPDGLGVNFMSEIDGGSLGLIPRNDDWDAGDSLRQSHTDGLGVFPSSGSGNLNLSCSRGPKGILSISVSSQVSSQDFMFRGASGSSQDGHGHSNSFADTMSSPSAVRGSGFAWVKGEILGRGTLGTVWKAMDQRTGQMIAVKEVQIDRKCDTDLKFQASLENEISIYKDLSHPHIVSYLGHDEIESSLYIYLEYMAGGSVAQVLTQFGPLDESLIATYAAELLDGLNYLHTRDPVVLHRDVKGANILVGLDGKIKLSDFGCSKRTADTLSRSMRGSIPWMAPEVINQSGGGRRSDIWSLGCVLIEMATAKHPWGTFDNPMAAMIQIGMSNSVPTIPDSLSEHARDFVRLCTQRDKALRPLACDLLKHPFVCEDMILTAM